MHLGQLVQAKLCSSLPGFCKLASYSCDVQKCGVGPSYKTVISTASFADGCPCFIILLHDKVFTCIQLHDEERNFSVFCHRGFSLERPKPTS